MELVECIWMINILLLTPSLHIFWRVVKHWRLCYGVTYEGVLALMVMFDIWSNHYNSPSLYLEWSIYYTRAQYLTGCAT